MLGFNRVSDNDDHDDPLPSSNPIHTSAHVCVLQVSQESVEQRLRARKLEADAAAAAAAKATAELSALQEELDRALKALAAANVASKAAQDKARQVGRRDGWVAGPRACILVCLLACVRRVSGVCGGGWCGSCASQRGGCVCACRVGQATLHCSVCSDSRQACWLCGTCSCVSLHSQWVHAAERCEHACMRCGVTSFPFLCKETHSAAGAGAWSICVVTVQKLIAEEVCNCFPL